MGKPFFEHVGTRIRKRWSNAVDPWRRFKRLAVRELADTSLNLERIGSDYGGWYVPVDLLTAQSICYLAGVGEDITFDLGLIDRIGCCVFAFDPTPRAAKHVAIAAKDVAQFHFFEIGLWSEDATMRFFAPQNPQHVSHSIVNLQRTDSYFDARCRPLRAIMDELGHDHIDLLKLDIEGAEHRVIASMLGDDIHPQIIAVEFDQPARYRQMRDSFHHLIAAGYSLINIDRYNLIFVQRALIV